MNINEALSIMSTSKTILSIDKDGNIELIRLGRTYKPTPNLQTVDGCIDLLWRMFNQKTNIKLFDNSFKKEFNELISKHSKRIGL